MNEIKLKPCPFCGGEAELKRFCTNHSKYFVTCRCCKARICISHTNDTKKEAIKVWNTRYEPPTPGGIFVPAGNDRFKKVRMSKNIGGKR